MATTGSEGFAACTFEILGLIEIPHSVRDFRKNLDFSASISIARSIYTELDIACIHPLGKSPRTIFAGCVVS